MCVNAQFSRKDCQSQAIFIDTEGSFSTIRVMQIAEETIKKLKENSYKCEVNEKNFKLKVNYIIN